MRAQRIVSHDGPGALRAAELPDPAPDHPMTPGAGVVIDVAAAGVSFPELLQSRGAYQVQPELPFVPGSEVAGVVRGASSGSGFAPGDRVAALTYLGGFAERAVAPANLTFRLPDELDFAQGAGLVLNYHTAYFALVTRGRLAAGERVLVQGAAGGVGTALLQVATGLGAETIAVVSTDAKAKIARACGATHVVSSDGPWRETVQELSGGGVELVVDPVGGDRFVDNLRALHEAGRLVVVGFAGGGIPEVRVNRLLLANTEVVGAGWGHYALSRPEYVRATAAALDDLIASGHVRPVVGARFPLDQASAALTLLDERAAAGKVVLELH